MNVLDSLREAFRRAAASKPGFTPDMQDEALLQVLALLGGERVVIPRSSRGKGGRPIPAEVRDRAYRDGLSTAPTSEVTRRHGISRATLYRIMKKGPGG